MNWLKRKLREWLGVDSNEMRIDTHEQHLFLHDNDLRNHCARLDGHNNHLTNIDGRIDEYQRDLSRFFSMRHPNYRTHDAELVGLKPERSVGVPPSKTTA